MTIKHTNAYFVIYEIFIKYISYYMKEKYYNSENVQYKICISTFSNQTCYVQNPSNQRVLI